MTCFQCVERRREFFVTMGAHFAQEHGLDLHAIVSWSMPFGQLPWPLLLTKLEILSRRLPSAKIGKYIRTMGIGTKRKIPHVHMLIASGGFAKLSVIAHRGQPPHSVIVNSVHVFDVEGLLGYFFDQNFLPTQRHAGRPRGIRVLSGSRGLIYGYPRAKDWKAFEALQSRAAKAKREGVTL